MCEVGPVASTQGRAVNFKLFNFFHVAALLRKKPKNAGIDLYVVGRAAAEVGVVFRTENSEAKG